MKQETCYEYLIAYNQIFENNNTIITTTDEYPGNDNIKLLILEEQKTPENLYFKKEAYQKLSEEAKEIIMIIVNAPAEMIELFSPKKHKTNINKVISYFKKIFGNRKTKLAIREIIKFVDNL